MTDPVKVIAARLLKTREALEVDQSEFCEQIGVKTNVYNPFETGKRRITLAVALKIRARYGISLDWIYCGDAKHLPGEIYRKLAKAA